ncbi:hypothetical protein [Nonomuraea soli]|uniref:LytS/YehU family sensor histidine kinase n=1 Tax=Nonomuraea soli TaxID=1032476 RepID=A0A7W0CDM0_9ACTN|nr:hypothetical protein [Nonomuraea soli]MBA2889213.1 LytS/YehU family sensor histidine kinase [Nonomuraea soli]
MTGLLTGVLIGVLTGVLTGVELTGLDGAGAAAIGVDTLAVSWLPQ